MALFVRTIEDDPYPRSPRLEPLKSILDKLRPKPAREPLPPRKQYEPPRFIRGTPTTRLGDLVI
jgi:hypothetical protein